MPEIETNQKANQSLIPQKKANRSLLKVRQASRKLNKERNSVNRILGARDELPLIREFLGPFSYRKPPYKQTVSHEQAPLRYGAPLHCNLARSWSTAPP